MVRHGSIGPVWADECELIRRLFVTVRDKGWQEVAPREWITEVDEPSSTVSISARHVSDLVDFAWQGKLQITGDGRELAFEFIGKALRDMEVCRLGLVVLHPVEWLVGAAVFAEDGKSEQSLNLSSVIAPQPIIDGIPGAITQPFSTLCIENSDLGKLELRFEGDLFELEDQRNWGDASFKTYCTPLRLGFPRSVKSGATISHRVRVRFERASTPKLRSPAIKPPAQASFPKIGRVWSPTLGSALWRHVHLRLKRDDSLAGLVRLLEGTDSTRLEVVMESQDDPGRLQGTLSLLAKHGQRVERLLVYGVGSSAPLADDLKRFELALRLHPALSDVPVLAATRGYFVEFNRAIPLNGPFSGIAFPLTATVHSDDADTIADNSAAIRDMANTARELSRSAVVALAPLAFYHPLPDPLRQFPAHLARPWLVASLIEAALAGVTSVTLADDVITAMADVAASEASLSDLVECSGMQMVSVEVDRPAGVHAAILKLPGNESSRLLAANLNSSAQLLKPSGVAIELPAFSTRLVDGTSLRGPA